jgi:hypothetical protein
VSDGSTSGVRPYREPFTVPLGSLSGVSVKDRSRLILLTLKTGPAAVELLADRFGRVSDRRPSQDLFTFT